jgi:hypothetical protein
MKKLTLFAFAAVCLLVGLGAAQDGGDPSGDANCGTNPCLTTYHNSNLRTGWNSREKVLVANNFPSLTATPVGLNVIDGMIYAQPLYMYQVPWTGSTTCPNPSNMVYAVTENNTIYAILADSPYTICGSQTLNNGDSAMYVSDSATCINLTGTTTDGTIGVTGTPAIDPNQDVMFVVSSHRSSSGSLTQRLTAVNIENLQILARLNDLATGINNLKQSGYPTFYVANEFQRSGLLITKSGTSAVNIYVTWSTFCDSNIASGGSFGLLAEFDYAYSSHSFSSTIETFYPEEKSTNLNFTPHAPAGVWMSGGAPAADGAGNLYIAVGNGIFDATIPNYGESILKLGGSPISVEDYYTPNAYKQLNQGGSGLICAVPGTTEYLCAAQQQPYTIDLSGGDWDLGAGGVVLLTPSSSSGFGELAAAGKEGMFYAVYYCSSSTNCKYPTYSNQIMGGLDGGGYGTNTGSLPTTTPCTQGTVSSMGNLGKAVQCFYGVLVTTRPESGQRATAAFWPGKTGSNGSSPYLYTVGASDTLKAYQFTTSTGQFSVTNAPAQSSSSFGYPGASPVITSNGTDFSSAVAWVLDTSSFKTGYDSISAYTANPGSGSTLTRLWTSPSGSGPGVTKFMVPTIANGKVYVAGQQNTSCSGVGNNPCPGLLVVYHP